MTTHLVPVVICDRCGVERAGSDGGSARHLIFRLRDDEGWVVYVEDYDDRPGVEHHVCPTCVARDVT